MHGVARNFFTLAVLYSLIGMTLGLHMAVSHDHAQVATHAHIMVLGWLMSAVFGFFYHLVPAAGGSRLASIHFWLSGISSAVMLFGLFMLFGGNPGIEPVLAVASLGFFGATLLFAFIALSALWRTDQATVRTVTN